MRREGWVWVGREARGEELASGARGAASEGRPVSGRTGSALPPSPGYSGLCQVLGAPRTHGR